MSKKNGPWTVQESSELHRDDFLTVRLDRVTRPDGEPGRYTTVAMKPGVAVLPVGEGGVVHLVRQFRYALGAESLEVPCGGVDAGESPGDAARREAREELGIEAAEWTDLGAFDLDTSIVTNKVTLFLARGLTFTETEREGSETIRPASIPFDEAVRLVLDGTITHGPSCVLILKARAGGHL